MKRKHRLTLRFVSGKILVVSTDKACGSKHRPVIPQTVTHYFDSVASHIARGASLGGNGGNRGGKRVVDIGENGPSLSIGPDTSCCTANGTHA